MEDILLRLPLRELARAHWISNHFKGVIDNSISIRCALWLEPLGEVRIFASRYPNKDSLEYKSLEYRRPRPRHPFSLHLWKPYGNVMLPHRPLLNPFLDEHIFHQYGRKSWQGAFNTYTIDYPAARDPLVHKMLPFHPPAMVVELKCVDCNSSTEVRPTECGSKGVVRTADLGDAIRRHGIKCEGWEKGEGREALYPYAGDKDIEFLEESHQDVWAYERVVDVITGHEMFAELERRAVTVVIPERDENDNGGMEWDEDDYYEGEDDDQYPARI